MTHTLLSRRFAFVALGLILAGQALFYATSPRYTAPRFEARLYTTLGVQFARGSDLHQLNEAAHYFGQTIIGWTKFPHFLPELSKALGFEPASLGAHMQERQNLIFTLDSSTPLTEESLRKARAYLQSKLDEYNRQSATTFVFTNTDEELVNKTRSYAGGALITLVLSMAVSLGAALAPSVFRLR